VIQRLSQVLILGVAFAAGPLMAQQSIEELEAAEARKQEAFKRGAEALVSSLNNGSFATFVAAIDRDDMIERIFGLRLIDPRIKRDFRDNMKERDNFERLIQSNFAMESAEGMKATLLLVESRGDRGRAVVRFDLPHFEVNYHEYDLRLNDRERIVIVDWNDYYWGHLWSERMGLSMVAAQPNKNAVRKLIDFPNAREQQVFQVVEVLKATRDNDFNRYFEIVNGLEEDLRRQRVVLKLGLDATRQARSRRNQVRILEWLAEYFPDDPLYSIALLDFYFPSREYQKAYDALIRLRDELDIDDDAVTNARLSSASLVLNQPEDSIAYAARAVASEPGLELAWWAVLRANVAAGQYASAVEALDRLEGDFGYSLGPEALGKDPTMQEFARSEAYRQWFEGKSS
jgi:hypothetical protein